jgi:aryl-alcohol dehydrogenase-like predicted oxidoreductase
MDYKKLGRTGLRVSPLCLGTMNFGPRTNEADSHIIMDAALDAGINFFDTANRYGIWGGIGSHHGHTEEIIGRWFAQGQSKREKVVLATKLYGQMQDWPNHSKLSALHIRQACEDSLRRLQTDHIDLYQMHHVDRDTPWEEIWQAMEQLVREGKVLYIGSSNFAGWHIAKANEAAKQRHFLGLVSEQCHYHLANRMPELELLPACADYGVGIIPWSPLGGGLLGGVLKKDNTSRRSDDRMQERVEQYRSQIEAWETFCDELGEEPAAVALAWLLHQPVVTAPIIGPRTMEQLTGAPLRALDITLNAEQLQRIDAIWSGYQTAPEHFAW